MDTEKYISKLVPLSFVLLWGSALALKLRNIELAKVEMKEQLFPIWATDILWWVLPCIHAILVLILLYRPTTGLGVKLSTVLISIYTIYLILGVTMVFGSAPCACAGIWPTNDHWLHIVLNSVFIILGIGYWVLVLKCHTEKVFDSELGRKEGTVSS